MKNTKTLKWFRTEDNMMVCKGAQVLICRNENKAKWNCDWAKVKRVISEKEIVVKMGYDGKGNERIVVKEQVIGNLF